MDINSTKPYLCCHDRSDKVRGCVFIFYRHPNIDDLASWTYNKLIRIKTINIWYYPMWLATENANIHVIVTPRRDVRWCWSVSTQATGNLLQDYGLSCVIVCNEQYDLDPHRWKSSYKQCEYLQDATLTEDYLVIAGLQQPSPSQPINSTQ